ncbi:germin-like protein 11-1 [Diospyros lotus]|uniref:germin-like protein 11-1 n=1 Tax=Diospyros lotus TaxID=55363 RepID=UPI002258CFB4|nr:germin-like protein 11-1 [Diospyros lotus]
MKLSSILLSAFFIINLCSALDDDNLQDTCPAAPPSGLRPLFINGFPCKSPFNVTASDFKSSKLSHPGDTRNFLRSSTAIATAADFPGLNTLGLAVARTDVEVGGLVAPHTHPRASEMFFLEKGSVIVGFIDTGNVIFQKRINAGDVFVFPRGLLHFCLNSGIESATAYSVLNSQNPGLLSISGSVFSPEDSEMAEKLKRRFVALAAAEMGRIESTTSLFGLEDTGNLI